MSLIGRVDAALLEQRDGLRPALDGLDGRAAAPARASYQLLVSDCAVVLPSRSSKLEIESSSSFTTMTPGETVYGALKRYFSSRSGLIETWFAMTSKRPASRPAKIASHCVSSNSTSRPSLSATASAISTS